MKHVVVLICVMTFGVGCLPANIVSSRLGGSLEKNNDPNLVFKEIETHYLKDGKEFLVSNIRFVYELDRSDKTYTRYVLAKYSTPKIKNSYEVILQSAPQDMKFDGFPWKKEDIAKDDKKYANLLSGQLAYLRQKQLGNSCKQILKDYYYISFPNLENELSNPKLNSLYLWNKSNLVIKHKASFSRVKPENKMKDLQVLEGEFSKSQKLISYYEIDDEKIIPVK